MHGQVHPGGLGRGHDAAQEIFEVVPHLLVGSPALGGHVIAIEIGEPEGTGQRPTAFRRGVRGADHHGIVAQLRHEVVAKRLDAQAPHRVQRTLVGGDLGIAARLAEDDEVDGRPAFDDGETQAAAFHADLLGAQRLERIRHALHVVIDEVRHADLREQAQVFVGGRLDDGGESHTESISNRARATSGWAASRLAPTAGRARR